MQWKTHLLFAALVVLLWLKHFSIQNSLFFALVALFSSIIVDIDKADSKAGRKLWPLSLIIEFFLRHRGLLHSFWIPLLFYVLVKNVSLIIASGFFVGYVSHLLLDALTVQGVTFFYPLHYRWKGFFVTGSFLEYCLQWLLVVLDLTLVLLWF